MRKFLNAILTVVAPLTGTPTAWAIFAGITNRAAFPMNDWIAGLGAVSILIVDIAAALLMADAYSLAQSSKSEEEQKQVQPLWWSLLIFITAIASEIVLSLVIVIAPEIKAYGVIVFPLMTTAGAFTVAARIDLTTRESLRMESRAKEEQERLEAIELRRKTREKNRLQKQALAMAELEQKSKKDSKQTQAKPKQIVEQISKQVTCPVCHTYSGTARQVAGHIGGAHPDYDRKNGKKSLEKLEETQQVVWTCSQCGTVNNGNRDACRSCESLRIEHEI